MNLESQCDPSIKYLNNVHCTKKEKRVKYKKASPTTARSPDGPSNYQCLQFGPPNYQLLFFGPLHQFMPSKWMKTESRARHVTLLAQKPENAPLLVFEISTMPLVKNACILHKRWDQMNPYLQICHS
jgi:hypothetical protein